MTALGSADLHEELQDGPEGKGLVDIAALDDHGHHLRQGRLRLKHQHPHAEGTEEDDVHRQQEHVQQAIHRHLPGLTAPANAGEAPDLHRNGLRKREKASRMVISKVNQ